MKDIREELYYKIIDFVFEEYNVKKQTKTEKEKNIVEFRERLMQWKIDFNYRKVIGPLQTAKVLSRIKKIPVKSVEQVAKEVGVILPYKINVSEFSLDALTEEEVESFLESSMSEDSFFDLIASMEAPREDLDVGEPFQPSSFEFVDMSNSNTEALRVIKDAKDTPMKLHVIQYLESIIQRVKRGDIFSLSVIALFNDGKSSMWMPSDLNTPETGKLYDQIVSQLREAGSILKDN